MAEAQPFLRLRGVSKRFGGLIALLDVDLDVARGEICGVIGPNGAGKSTLFNIVAGTYPPSTGEARLGDAQISGLPSHRVAAIGVARAFQLVNLFSSMTVAENVLVGAERPARLKVWQAITHLGSFGRDRGSRMHLATYELRLVDRGETR